MKKFLKKYGNYIVIAVFSIILLVPQIRFPVQVFIQRLISFSPSEIEEEEREILEDYHWNLSDLEGNIHAFEDVKGEVILINFWATWCPPCIAELPDLEELYKDYGDKVNFFFVSDESKDKLKAFLTKRELDIPVFSSITAIPGMLYYTALPTTFLIAKNGEIVMRKEGSANWNSKKVRDVIEQLLN